LSAATVSLQCLGSGCELDNFGRDLFLPKLPLAPQQGSKLLLRVVGGF